MPWRSTWNGEELKSIFEAFGSKTSLYLIRSKTEIPCSFDNKEIDALSQIMCDTTSSI